MRGGWAGAWIAVGLTLASCSLDRVGVAAGTDSAVDPLDGGWGIDAYLPPGEDGGPPVDARVPLVDAPGCTARCSGDTAIVCSADGETSFDCTLADAVCESNSGVARCTGGACGGPMCSSDGISALQCAAGIPGSPIACDRGCEGGACRLQVPCGLAVAGTIRPGEMRNLDLCGQGDDGTQTGCNSSRSDTEDVILRLDVDHRATYRIEIRDVDPATPVDPVLYVRTACADEGSQIECDDDGGSTALDALGDVTLDPGEYFLWVDAFDWTDGGTMYRCGQVAVSVVER